MAATTNARSNAATHQVASSPQAVASTAQPRQASPAHAMIRWLIPVAVVCLVLFPILVAYIFREGKGIKKRLNRLETAAQPGGLQKAPPIIRRTSTGSAGAAPEEWTTTTLRR
jgi:hypothetical protein